MTDQPANLDLDEIATRAGHLWEYVQQPDEADVLAGTDVPALLAEVRRLRSELADARTQALRDAAEICDEAGAVYGSRGANDAAGAAFALMERFQRKANEAEYVATPCDLMNPCEDGGEPCHVHERLMAHADGEHELCGDDCTAP